MSALPPPPHFPGPHGQPSQPTKPRPRAIWWVIGATLLVLAAGTFVAGLVLALGPLFKQDAVIAADGESHRVMLSDRTDRGLFVREGTELPPCEVMDSNGVVTPLDPPMGTFTSNGWRAVVIFDARTVQVDVTCQVADGVEVRVGAVPSMRSFVMGILIGVLGPLVLGLLGALTLIITGVLWVKRAPRR